MDYTRQINESVHSITQNIENFTAFSKLKNDEARVYFFRDKWPFGEFIRNDEYRKSSSTSESLRISGNCAFQQKDYAKALLLYTRSIAKAPHLSANDDEVTREMKRSAKEETNELALGLANRSAVLFSLGQYEPALKDIDLAFEMSYPPTLLYKLHNRKGRCLKFQGNVESALKSFKNALDSLSLASSLSEQKKHVLEKELNIMITQSEKTLTEKPLQKMPELQNKAFFLPRISYGQNEKIPCASDCITIKNSKKMGRCLVATRDITIGDVLAVEEPFVSFLMPEFRHTHCHNCYLKCHTLLPCHYCSMAMFCSESCRKASWEKNHSIICSVSPYLDELGRAVNLSLLIIIKASRNYKSLTELYQQVKSWEGKDFPKNYFDENGQYGSQDYKNIYNLVTNSEKRPLEHSFRSAALAFYVLKCLEDESKFFTSFIPSQSRPFDVKLFIGGVLLRHLQNTTYNAYTVFESYRFGNTDKSMDYREIGAAVYATMSLMNHSCDPNVNRFNCNDTLILRVIQPIKKGEQVLASYGPHFYIQERDERILELKNNYCFTCKCEACRNNWPKEPSMSLDKLKYKCQTCGFGLPAAQTREHVICSNCKFLNNVEEISTLVKKSFGQCEINALHKNDINQSIKHMCKLHQYLEKPWPGHKVLIASLTDYYMKLGNHYECKINIEI